MSSTTPNITDDESPKPPCNAVFFSDEGAKQEQTFNSPYVQSANTLQSSKVRSELRVLAVNQNITQLKEVIDTFFGVQNEEDIEEEVRRATFKDYCNDDEKITETPTLGELKEDYETAPADWQNADYEESVLKKELKDKRIRALGKGNIPFSAEYNIKHTEVAAKQSVKWLKAYRYESQRKKAQALKKALKKTRENKKDAAMLAKKQAKIGMAPKRVRVPNRISKK